MWHQSTPRRRGAVARGEPQPPAAALRQREPDPAHAGQGGEVGEQARRRRRRSRRLPPGPVRAERDVPVVPSARRLRRRRRVWHDLTIRERALQRALVQGSHNGAVAGSEGTPAGHAPRGGARRAAKPKRSVQPKLLALGLGGARGAGRLGAVWCGWPSTPAARRAAASRASGATWPWRRSARWSACSCACGWCTVLLRRVGLLEDPRRPVQTHRH